MQGFKAVLAQMVQLAELLLLHGRKCEGQAVWIKNLQGKRLFLGTEVVTDPGCGSGQV